MATKEVQLDLAAFLDSPECGQLLASDGAPSRDDARRAVRVFLKCCYEELGKKPRFLDGHDVHAVLGHLMPGHLSRGDAVAAHVPAILEAYIAHLESTQVVTQAFEMRRGLEGTVDEFQEAVRTGQLARHGEREEPFVHGAPKLGRNDPCSCGSGKKFKKCHGKNA